MVDAEALPGQPRRRRSSTARRFCRRTLERPRPGSCATACRSREDAPARSRDGRSNGGRPRGRPAPRSAKTFDTICDEFRADASSPVADGHRRRAATCTSSRTRVVVHELRETSPSPPMAIARDQRQTSGRCDGAHEVARRACHATPFCPKAPPTACRATASASSGRSARTSTKPTYHHREVILPLVGWRRTVIETGDKAPDFALPDQDGRKVAQRSRARWWSSTSTPRPSTPDGDEHAACATAGATRGRRRGRVGRIRRTPVAKVKKCTKPTEPLLANKGHHLADAYGVWAEKSMYGKTYFGNERTTFVIRPTAWSRFSARSSRVSATSAYRPRGDRAAVACRRPHASWRPATVWLSARLRTCPGSRTSVSVSTASAHRLCWPPIPVGVGRLFICGDSGLTAVPQEVTVR